MILFVDAAVQAHCLANGFIRAVDAMAAGSETTQAGTTAPALQTQKAPDIHPGPSHCL